MNRVLESLRKFQLAQAAALRRASDALGVSETDLNAIRTLITITSDDGVAMKDLAHDVGVSPAVLTGIVDRFEEKGWARRQVHRTDRRSIRIVATVTEGSPVAKILAALDEPLRKVANSLSDDTAAVIRRLAAELEAELRNFHPDSAMAGSSA